jgi:hypothetical protein
MKSKGLEQVLQPLFLLKRPGILSSIPSPKPANTLGLWESRSALLEYHHSLHRILTDMCKSEF